MNFFFRNLKIVQDATIQTDTPEMSEDDNTNNADDSAYSSNIMVNSNSMTEDMNVSVPTSSSCAEICHSISESSSLYSPPPNISPQSTSFTSDMIHSSSIGPSLSCSIGINTTSELNKSMESSFEMAVSSTNTIEDERSLNQQTPESDVLTVRTATPHSQHQPPTDLTVNSSNMQFTATSPVQTEKSLPDSIKSAGPDISGLELLSNSIEAFEKRPRSIIKQEPVERSQISPTVYESTSFSPQYTIDETRRSGDEQQFECQASILSNSPSQSPPQLQPPPKTTYNPANEQLGGLNLLCALAEQHFQEEVSNEHRMERKRSSSSDGSEPKRIKKHKEKQDTINTAKKNQQQQQQQQVSQQQAHERQNERMQMNSPEKRNYKRKIMKQTTFCK